MDSQTRNDFEFYEKREVLDKYPLGNLSYEKAFNTVDWAYHYIIVADEQIIMSGLANGNSDYIEAFYEGMKQGYKIAAHKNEAKELMREMGMDDNVS